MAEAAKSITPGEIFAQKFRILEKIGEGGMGAVYRAEHQLIGRIVALKLLHAHLSSDETYLKRFEREARIACKLEHPHAITLYDFGVENGVPYLVMQFVSGKSLKALLSSEGALKLDRIDNIFQQVGGAVAVAHSLDVVHRDLKPDNILVTPKDGADFAHVLDFGVAKVMGLTSSEQSVAVTQQGVFTGTPQYMSPEQATMEAVDYRSDIYSLGIILYEMLTGEVPFQANSPLGMLVEQVKTIPVPVRDLKPHLQIPERVSKVVMKALEKAPANRFQCVTEFVSAFHEAVSAPVSPAPVPPVLKGAVETSFIPAARTAGRTGWYAAGGLLALLIAAAGYSALAGKGELAANDTQLAEAEKVSEAASSSQQSALEAVRAGEITLPSKTTDSEIQAALEAAALEALQRRVSASSSESAPAQQAAVAQTILAPVAPADAQAAVSSESSSAVTSVQDAASDSSASSQIVLASQNFSQQSSSSSAEDPAAAERLYQEGKKLLKDKDYIRAGIAFKKAVSIRENHLLARLSLGLCFLRLAKPDYALREFEKARALDPHYAPTHYNLAMYYSAVGAKEQALQALQEAIKLFPGVKEWAKSDPDLAPISGEPKFQELIR